MHVDLMVLGALFMALLFYVLTGGADYGAGVWSIFVSKHLRDRQHDLIATAIQPIWETNHVWLILVVVLLFTAYPPAFAFISTTLNIPISLALLGVVMRGTAFVSMKYDNNSCREQKNWNRLFAGASIITPFLYGTVIGAISTGRLPMPTDQIWQTLFAPWLTPYCLCLGGFTLSVFSMLAATYLTVDADGDDELQLSFRARALVIHMVLSLFAVASVFFASNGDVFVYHRIARLPWALAAGGGFIACFMATVACLLTRHYKWARVLAAAEATVILLGFASAQFPFIVPPDYSVINCSAPHSVLALLVVALALGAVLLFPSLFYLYRIFKGEGQNATQGAPLH